ncbi:MAG: glycosyl transferase [Pseudomonadota bacterium]
MARVLVFSPDIAEAAQIRRVLALQQVGHAVSAYAFRRRNMNEAFTPDWPTILLGETRNHSFLTRGAQMVRGVAQVLRAPDLAREAEVWIARNIDMALIGHAARRLLGLDVPIAYECLDIHSLFTRTDAVGRGMRAAERRVLRDSALLITSSPGFVREYFGPVQGYDGPVVLLENKLWLEGADLQRPSQRRRVGAPLVIGSAGSIRCARSLDILTEAARRLGPKVEIALHGNAHRHAVPEFDALVASQDNITWHGPYEYPQGLGPVYAACDLVWAQDLWQTGGNSDWLLPNRIYEASWHGCPSVAASGTETGRRIEADGLGFTLPEASADALVALVERLDSAEIDRVSDALLAMPEARFRQSPGEVAEIVDRLLAPDLGHLVAGPADKAGAKAG